MNRPLSPFAAPDDPPRPTRDTSSISRLPSIEPAQLRAARNLLGWSRGSLSKECKISPETIKNMEHGIFTPKKATLLALIKTFARHGVQFVHYETVISVPADNEQSERLQPLFYAGVIRLMNPGPESKKDGHA